MINLYSPKYTILTFIFPCLLLFSGFVDSDNQPSSSSYELLSTTNIDVDGNDQFDAQTDGLLILRSMFGLTDSALIAGAVANDAVYSDAEDIQSRIGNLGNRLDIDNNGAVDALTDGLIILRYLFGYTGESLVSGAIGSDAGRVSALDIESHMATLAPYRSMPMTNIDIDGNGQFDALTDGLLILRSMFGMTESALVAGAVASDAIYSDAEDIQSRIGALGNRLDIDNNGAVDALTDGLIILRYLSGYTGDALVNAVVASNASRASAVDIEYYMMTLTSTGKISHIFTSPDSFLVEENRLAIGKVTATAYNNSSITFSVSGAEFSITPNGILRFVSVPDYETKSSYTAKVTASGGGDSTTQTITVSVTDIDDEMPQFTSSLIWNAPENQTAIGTLTASDIDSDDSTITFRTTGQYSSFDLTPEGILTFKDTPDYDFSWRTHQEDIEACDEAGNCKQVEITVNVTDIDDIAPFFTSSASFNAAENQTAIGTVTATDIDTDNELITFTASGSELLITPDGVLSFASAPDYEAKSFYTSTVTATDGTNSTTMSVQVGVTNVDDVGPQFISATTFSISETHYQNGISVAVTDIDTDDKSSIEFSVSGSEFSITTDNNSVRAYAHLAFLSPPDYEQKSIYTTTVTASDGINTTTQDIIIYIEDKDDTAPVFSSPASFTIPENQTSIGRVVVTDPDTSHFNFTISGTDASSIMFSNYYSMSADLVFKGLPDYETKSSYNLTVTAFGGDSITQDITIFITDIDDVAPVITSGANFRVRENRRWIGKVKATDLDTDNASITYTVSGTELLINSGGGLRFASLPDYEAKSSYSATVTATDGINSATQAITVAVTDIDDTAPVFTSDASFSAAENQTAIGTVTATDIDTDYELITFTVSGSELLITPDGVLSFATAPDYETQSSYSATLTATDGTNSTTQAITVAVTDIDDTAPVFTSGANFTAPENQTAIGTVTATDRGAGNGSITYTVSGSELNMTSAGVLSFDSAPDYETKSTYSATVTATDGIQSTTQAITVTVTDIDDTAPVFTSSASFNAAENQTAIGTMTATDIDTDNELITFTVSGSELLITPDGVLSFTSAPNYENKLFYSATVTASDGVRTTSQYITVSVTDISEALPILVGPVHPIQTFRKGFHVPENETLIGTIIASDGDSLSWDFYLENPYDNACDNNFLLSPEGELSFVDAPDYEDGGFSCFPIVVVRDSEKNLSTNQIFVTVFDVDDVAPVFTSGASFSAAENQTAIGAVTATDIDTDNGSITYTVTGSELLITSDGVLSFATAPDYEAKTSYSAIVTATDGTNSTTQNITVTIVNSPNDESPAFTSGADFSAAENQTAIGRVTAEDIDTDNGSIIYTVSGSELLITYDGLLTFATAPDYETQSSYSATVTASDGTNSTTQTITVNVTNIDDTAPVFTSGIGFSALENQTAIGRVTATDIDTDNGSISYTVSGSELLITSDGMLSFAAAPDYETKTSYSATVTATDGTNSTTQNITVTVINSPNDESPVFTSGANFSVVEGQTAIGRVTAEDIDTDNASIAYAVSGSELFITSNGLLSFATAPDYETQSSFSATVTASDGTNTTTQTITVNVTDIDDEAPAFTSGADFSAAENQTAIGRVTAEDIDTDNGSITFTVSGSELLMTSDGLLSFATAPDYEAKTSYSATVTATDGTNSATQDIVVVVNDINDSPPVFISSSSFSADENQTSIGAITATDPEDNDITFTISGSEMAVTSSGILTFISAPDFETKSLYEATVTATDGTNSATQTIRVNVTNIDDSAPIFTSGISFSALENQTAIGRVTATDLDTDNGSISYTVSGSELLITPDGVLLFATVPDYENKSFYSATVTATDGVNSTTQAITVDVTDIDDEAPVFNSNTSFTVAENQTVIGSVTATDMDTDNGSITFTVSGSELLVTSDGLLSFATAPDYETKSSYSATLTVTDGANYSTQSVYVSVTNVNERPVITSASVYSANENQTVIGFISAADDSENLIYELAGTDAASLAINNATGEIEFISAPDYEVKSSYSAIARVYDDEYFTQKAFQIFIVNLDDTAPVLTSASTFFAAENQTAIGAVTATDIDTDDGLITYSVSGSDLLITSGGELSFASAPDFETRSSYSATVTATDGANSATQDITVTVTDANDLPPVFTSSSSFTALENQTVIGTVTATDMDTDNGLITFTVSGPELLITPDGVLTFASAPDYEASAAYNATVTAKDGINSATQIITITVTDIDDTAPVFTSGTSFSAAENQTAIGAVMASDIDTDDELITYSVSGSDLLITSAGVLSFASAPDYEVKSSYIATVTATDGINSTTRNITVNVTDIDDTAPVFTSDASFTAAENQTAIGQVTASDIDTDNGLITYSVSGTELLITSDGVLSFALAPDHEAKSSYSAMVTATDGNHSATQSITITVTNVDDTAPVFTSGASYSASENQTTIGMVTANDIDTDNELITYTVSGTELLMSSSGVLSFASAPDYEAKSSYTATVTATDGINSISQAIIVNVSDIDDTAPVFTSGASYSATENQTAIGTVTATDIDTDNGLITYTVSGSEFLITSDGVLSFASAPDYESKPFYSATVTATDGTYSATQEITVSVNNINDNSPAFTSSATLNADENQRSVGVITAIDADGDAVIYSIPTNSGQVGWTADSGDFTIDSTTGVIAFKNNRTPPNYENKNYYSFNIIASDGANNTMQTVELIINDVNDRPQISIFPYINVNENQVSISTVTATDEDNDAVTFTVSGTDSSFVNINPSSGVLTFVSAPDYETKSTYSVTVTASDGTENSSVNLTINIIDVNESIPVITSPSTFNISENERVIGTVTAVDSIDNETLRYNLVSSSSHGIFVDRNTGELTFSDYFIQNGGNDYETYTSHTIKVTAQDSFGHSDPQEITINLSNLNDNSPLLWGWCYSMRADENQTTVHNCVTGDGSLKATDADGDTLTFSMTSSDGLAISADGVLSFSSPPDFEADIFRTGTVSVTDGLNTTTRPITVVLNNLNDNAPTFPTETITFEKDERHWNSGCILTCAEVGTVTAIDADFNGGAGFGFTYSIISQEHANIFEIDPLTGLITTLEPHLDYETDSAYTLTVQASDGELSDTVDVIVNVRNLNEGPYISSPTNLSINENETIVATITADDYEGFSSNNPISIHVMRDGGGGMPSAECQLLGDTRGDCEFFSIETLSPNTARLIMTAPDFENPQDENQDNVYNLKIGLSMGYVRCGYHFPYCGQAFDFTVTVNDVNEAPYLYSYSAVSWDKDKVTFTGTAPNITAVTIDREENLIDRSLGVITDELVRFSARDDDIEQYWLEPISCSISGIDASLLYVRSLGNSCRIYFDSPPDYETKSSYSAVLTFTDGTLEDEVDLTVNIIDVDE